VKLAYCVLLPDSAVSVAAYRGKGLEETLRDIADIGYEGVELFLREPESLDRAELEKALQKTGLEVCCVGTAPLAAQDRLALANPDKEKRLAAISRVKKLIDFASAYGRIPVGIGKFRGNLPPGDRPSGWKWLREGFLEVCEYAEGKNVLIALEPQERGNLNNLTSTRDGVVWVEQLGMRNCFLLLDTYHMALGDESLTAGILEAAGKIAHVHVSDSGRAAPGQGTLDFVSAVRALRAVGYDGFLSVEIAQGSDALGSARKAWAHLNSIRNMYT
jgi:sugar phosphate isomerase/epimerase